VETCSRPLRAGVDAHCWRDAIKQRDFGGADSPMCPAPSECPYKHVVSSIGLRQGRGGVQGLPPCVRVVPVEAARRELGIAELGKAIRFAATFSRGGTVYHGLEVRGAAAGSTASPIPSPAGPVASDTFVGAVKLGEARSRLYCGLQADNGDVVAFDGPSGTVILCCADHGDGVIQGLEPVQGLYWHLGVLVQSGAVSFWRRCLPGGPWESTGVVHTMVGNLAPFYQADRAYATVALLAPSSRSPVAGA